MKRLLAGSAAAVLVAAIGVSVGTTPATAGDTTGMTTAEAGRLYLRAVCPSNRANAAVRRIWTAELPARVPLGTPISDRLAAAFETSAVLSERQARILADARGWPAPVRARDIALIVRDSRQQARVDALRARTQEVRGTYRNIDGHAPDRVRAALDLPPRGANDGC